VLKSDTCQRNKISPHLCLLIGSAEGRAAIKVLLYLIEKGGKEVVKRIDFKPLIRLKAIEGNAKQAQCP